MNKKKMKLAAALACAAMALAGQAEAGAAGKKACAAVYPASKGFAGPVSAMNGVLAAYDARSREAMEEALGWQGMDRQEARQAAALAKKIREGGTLSYLPSGMAVYEAASGQTILWFSKDKKGLWRIGKIMSLCGSGEGNEDGRGRGGAGHGFGS